MALTPGHFHEARDPGLTPEDPIPLKLLSDERPPEQAHGIGEEAGLVAAMEAIASQLATIVLGMKIACVLLVLAVAGHVLRLAGVG